MSPKSLSIKSKPNSGGRPRRLKNECSMVGSKEWNDILLDLDELSLVDVGDLELVYKDWNSRSKGKSEAMRLVEGRVVHSQIIKASIDKDIEYRIDRARCSGMQLTRPAFVRLAVSELISYLADPDAVVNVSTPKRTIPGEGSRKLYLKVAFAPAVVDKIGHHKPVPYGLCERLGMTRQQVIDFALRRILER